MKLSGLITSKNKPIKPFVWLVLIFLLVLGIRLYVAFETPLLNYEAYFNLRQTEDIKNTGFPLYEDNLSYGGKTQLFAPLNHYILAAFSLIIPIEIVGKILPNIIAAMIIFIVYYLSLKITKNTKISLFTSFMSGFIPIYFIDINRVSINYLAILLIFTIVYCLLKLSERKYVDYALILMFLLVLTTPLAFVLIIGLLLYLVLLKLENFAIEMKELEIILFFTFLVFWVNLLIYKNAFLIHGLLVVWKNIPMQILANFFGNIGFIQSLGAISIIPIVFGVYAFYAAFHLDRSKEILILIALGMSTFILLWFKLLDIVTGFMFLSITLVILTAYSLKRFDDFISKSKIHKYDKLLMGALIVLFIITTIPSILYIVNNPDFGPSNTPSLSDVEALNWAKENLPKTACIASGLDEGNMVAYFGERKNIMDTNFLLTPRIDQRLKDINELYTTAFETRSIDILNEYNAKYLLVTKNTLEEYGIDEIKYLKDSSCFKIEYQNTETYLYSMNCKLK
ncbi:MAG: hypothetical protein ACP5N1_06525 [Candidatus Woesearchaeota archaeon]